MLYPTNGQMGLNFDPFPLAFPSKEEDRLSVEKHHVLWSSLYSSLALKKHRLIVNVERSEVLLNIMIFSCHIHFTKFQNKKMTTFNWVKNKTLNWLQIQQSHGILFTSWCFCHPQSSTPSLNPPKIIKPNTRSDKSRGASQSCDRITAIVCCRIMRPWCGILSAMITNVKCRSSRPRFSYSPTRPWYVGHKCAHV